MRTTLTLDDDVFEAAKELSEASGKRLGEVVSILIRRGLQSHQDFASENGLPVFQVPPGTPLIPGSRARDLLSEEEP